MCGRSRGRAIHAVAVWARCPSAARCRPSEGAARPPAPPARNFIAFWNKKQCARSKWSYLSDADPTRSPTFDPRRRRIWRPRYELQLPGDLIPPAAPWWSPSLWHRTRGRAVRGSKALSELEVDLTVSRPERTQLAPVITPQSVRDQSSFIAAWLRVDLQWQCQRGA